MRPYRRRTRATAVPPGPRGPRTRLARARCVTRCGSGVRPPSPCAVVRASVDNSVRLGLSSLRGHRRLMPCLARAPSSGGRSVTPHVGSSTSPGRRRRRPCRPTTSRTRRLTASTRPTCKAICRRLVSPQTWHLLAISPVDQAQGIIDPCLSRAATRAFSTNSLAPPGPNSPLPTPPPLSCPLSRPCRPFAVFALAFISCCMPADRCLKLPRIDWDVCCRDL